MPTHVINFCSKFHQNCSTKRRDSASRETGVNGDNRWIHDRKTMSSPLTVGDRDIKMILRHALNAKNRSRRTALIKTDTWNSRAEEVDGFKQHKQQ